MFILFVLHYGMYDCYKIIVFHAFNVYTNFTESDHRKKAIYTQREAPVMKEDYEVEEEAIGSVPRFHV
jgi:hypothetical protein